MTKEDVEIYKQQAAERAADFVTSGTVIGLGTGSTAQYVLEAIARRLRAGELEGLEGVPTSAQTEHLARKLGIPLTTLDERPVIDLTIDGADEVDDALNLIKGGGGALLREKVVAQASRRYMIVVDDGKCSPRVGTRWALPVEVIPMAQGSESNFLKSLGARVTVRVGSDGVPVNTDNGNIILDADFGPIADPKTLDRKLDARAGIMAHGLFLELTTDLIVAGKEGVRHLKPKPEPHNPDIAPNGEAHGQGILRRSRREPTASLE